MATVDDIAIAGAVTAGEVAQLISAALGVPVSGLPDGSPCVRIGDLARVTVYPDDDYPGQWVAEVHHSGSDQDQNELARRIYDYLVDSTDWGLTLTSDVAPEYIVATRKRP